MDNLEINKVHDFWNSESCGERYALGDSNVEKFLNEEKSRYKLEPYIKFANFDEYKNKDVLEIGVGFGCDHSQIARQKPNSLTGIDLTQRAIDNTELRFKTLGLNSSLKTEMLKNYLLRIILLKPFIVGVFYTILQILKNVLMNCIEF